MAKTDTDPMAEAKAWIASALRFEEFMRQVRGQAATARTTEPDWHDEDGGHSADAA